MDVSYLLDNFRPIGPEDMFRKEMALKYAWNVLQTNDSFEVFLGKLSPSTKLHVFGSGGDDSYFSAMMAVVEACDGHCDGILYAALNKVALQLEYQTRYLGSANGPELYVYDGPAAGFNAAMANVNATAGVLIRDAVPVVAKSPWMAGTANIEFNPSNMHVRARSDFATFMRDIERRVGAVGIVLENSTDVYELASQFASLTPYVGYHTIYLISGPADVVSQIAADGRAKYPQARLHERRYALDVEGALLDKAILVADGFETLPELTWTHVMEMPCRFVMARGNPNSDFKVMDYRPSEYVGPKAPGFIATNVPVSDENNRKMTQDFEFFHNLVAIRAGAIMGLHGSVDSTYIHFAENGEIAMDCGNEYSRTQMSDLYQSGSDVNGIRQSLLRFNEIRRVPGAALPLTFTPDVHTFFSHFMLQCLPRLLILDEIGYPDAKIIVPHNLRRKQFDMLRLAGISDDRIVRMPPGVVLKADMLLVPRTWPLGMSPFTARVYETMLSRVVNQAVAPKRRILISRESRRTWRNMVTYDAVRHMLVEQHGFEVIRPEALTLEQEIALFNDAKVVVGAEGAGLYGAVFCQNTASVISLCDEDYMMPILGTIAKIRDFSLCHVFGESFRADRDLERRLPYGHCDFAIDPVEVHRMVLRCV